MPKTYGTDRDHQHSHAYKRILAEFKEYKLEKVPTKSDLKRATSEHFRATGDAS